MFLHRNAALTPVKRRELVDLLDRGMPMTVAAAHFGVAVSTVRRWRDRARESPGDSLEDRSSRPHRLRNPLGAEVKLRVVALRIARRDMTRIAAEVGVSIASVSRILARAGLSRMRDVDPPEPDNRYEHPEPGDMLHIDTKRIPRFDFPGHRVTNDPSKGNRKGIGHDFVFVAVDDHSRLAFCGIYPDERADSAADFIRRALNGMAQVGAPVKRVLTDNAAIFRTQQARLAYEEHGCAHKTTRPYRPRTNGKAERFIQTLLREWAYATTYQNSDERNWRLVEYVYRYNLERKHSALQNKPPASRIPHLWKDDI